ncbi:DUF5723 family protein [Hymenobacter arizonensis]|nr:DUF5723 family protein [Hymenobacter arizonensis]
MHTPVLTRWPRPLLFAMLLLGARTGSGQGWTGLAHSNYGGTNNLYINPATLADSRHGFYLNLGAANVNFYNTYLQLELPAPAREFINGNRQIEKEYLKEQLNGDAKFASITGEGRLPSFMLSLGPNQGIAFTNRVRAFVQANNVSENLARLAYNGFDDVNRLGLNQLSTDNNFNFSGGSHHEFALSYGRTLTPNTEHFLKVGGTVKYLVGLGGAFLLNEGTEYHVYDDNSVELRDRKLSYAFTNPDFYDQPNFGAGTPYGSQRLGSGFGFDLGVMYEWRPKYDKYQYHMDGKDWTDPSRNKYRMRVGLALTDVGAIRYGNDQYVRQARIANNGVVKINTDDVDIDDVNDISPTFDRLIGLSEQTTRFTSYLPTTLRLTGDYRLVNHIFAGLMWTQNLLPANTIGQRSLSSLALTPRIEFARAEIATPIMLANNYRKLQLGAMVRLGPLIVGSDNLGGLMGLTTTTGADLYFGLSLAIQKKRHKDKDNDQVSNKLDKCPKVKGSWEYKGCPAPVVPATIAPDAAPDTTTPAPAATPASDTVPAAAPATTPAAAPDKDGDGVPDAEDKCPDTPGTAENGGCPKAN